MTDIARVQAMGEVTATSLDYSGIRYQRLAVRVTERDLRAPELQPTPRSKSTQSTRCNSAPSGLPTKSADYLGNEGFSLSGNSYDADAEPLLP